MKTRHNTVKIVLATLLVFVLLTWILPAAYYSSGYVEQGRMQMGLFDLFSYPITALSYFGYIAIFMLVVGGFYGILGQTGAYRNLLDKLATSFKKRGKLTISIIIVLIAIVTSICGLQLGLIIFFPFIISLILLMGYDKIVAALTVVGSTMIGIIGTTFAYSNTSVIMSTLSLKITSNILVKVIILVLGLTLLIFNTIRYMKIVEKRNKEEKAKASKIKKAEKKEEIETKSVKKSTKDTKTSKTSKTRVAASKKTEEVKVVKEEKKEEKLDSKIADYVPKDNKSKNKAWPLVVIFSLIFIVMVLSFISWTGAFNNSMFEKATTSVTSFKVFGFPLFAKILGNVNPFGNWNLTELSAVLFIASLLLMIIYKIKFSDGLQAFITGAKRALEPAVLVLLIYTGLVIVTYHPFQLVIYKFLFGFTKGFNIITSTFAAIIASVFNADPLYTFQSVLPYLSSLVSNKSTYAIIGVVYQAMYGVTMLIAPTSIVLMSVLSYLGISYKEWFKRIWQLLLELIILLLIIFTILVLI